ncbi:MAG: enoyl-CoA hydratase/isomerase family protein [Acidobacteria bacterium]|nr:enoyl-CoA hydratase/isomerase family protein [Acidobacteriota bacterium]
MKEIHRVAVLGAGTMGARIAAHFANAGVPSYLLDIVPPKSDFPVRNKIAAAGLEAAKRSKPAAFFETSLAHLITIGNFEDDLGRLARVDWIIEAVVENLALKRELLKKVEAVRQPGTIVTTNTSGLPVAAIADGFSEDFRRSWFGTHFFNPPRYMRLLEIIPTPETDRGMVEAVSWFADVHLGKGVVFAKDTPNFIANRIGTFSVLNAMRLMQEMDLTIEEVDALTGPAIGWPKSATFRTIDLVGLDILAHVVGNMEKTPSQSGQAMRLPEFFEQMLARNWLGDKTRGGFYKKVEGNDGQEQRLGLDWKTLEYRPQQKAKFPPLEMAKNLEDVGARIRMLLGLGSAGAAKADRSQTFLWSAVTDLWNYSADRVPEICDSIVEIDRAMRLGFNWELGPFELWDAAGVEATVERMGREGRRVPPQAETLLASGRKTWYVDARESPSGRAFWQLTSGEYTPLPVAPGVWSVAVAKKSKGVVKKNSSASLVDLGDGIACIEFHSKMNSLGADIVSLITESLKPHGPAADFQGFVITNDGVNFSAGANLMLLLMSIEEQEWDEIDLAVRQFQAMTQAIKFSTRPVVVAPFGLTLGGAAEMTLHGPARQAHAELYVGLVEVGVGLIPAGGGCKEMLLRAIDTASALRRGTRSAGALSDSVELLEAVKKAFEITATAKTATSAEEARALGFLFAQDGITMNRERLLADAKARALELVRAGYGPPSPRSDIPAPGENILATLKLGVHLMRQGGHITEHEALLGTKIAEILSGGELTPGTPISEQHLLDLECEAFKSLCGERKTQERIRYTLKTGRPLRN